MSKLNEIIVSQLPIQSEVKPCTAYLLDNGDGTHDRYVSDENGNISKQAGGIKTIQAGANITIDNTDPKNPIISSTGGDETDPIFSASPSATITNSDINNWNSKLSAEVDTLQSVVNRGNSSTKPIIFNPDQNRAGELGFNKDSYSYYFGNHSNSNSAYYNNAIGYNCLNNVTTGQSNNGFGSYTMELLTTGEYNASFGGYSLTKLVSGRRNSAFGNATGNKLTTGSHNTMLGIGALPNATTSNSNIAVGDNSLPNVVTKGNNIGIGKDTGAEGEAAHCVYIGSRAGTNNTIDGVLAIHNWRLNLPNTGVGSYAETVAQMNAANSLIYGNFIQKFLKINGSFSLNPSFIPNATGDSTYTKNIVAKPDGTFGWENKVSLSTKRPSMARFITNNSSFTDSSGDFISLCTPADITYNVDHTDVYPSYLLYVEGDNPGITYIKNNNKSIHFTELLTGRQSYSPGVLIPLVSKGTYVVSVYESSLWINRIS